jgi:hypothetical protein
MKRQSEVLIGLFAVILLVSFSPSARAQLGSGNDEDTPEIFQLNTSLSFDKATIKDWAKENSWKKARDFVRDAHSRKGRQGLRRRIEAILGTPIVIWVESFYVGDQKGWSEERVKERYKSKLYNPEDTIYFLTLIQDAAKEGVKLDNLKFVMDNGSSKRWEPKEVEARDLQEKGFFGMEIYFLPVEVRFNITEAKDTEWEQLTLHVIRKGKEESIDLTWDF